MRIAARAALAFALGSAVAGSAGAAPYDRKVRIDWAPIEGAGRYEVQWGKAALDGACAPDAMDADSSLAVDEVGGPFWQKSLPGGAYCVRVRGIGVGERPGQWTDPQLLPVKPKPPGGVRWEEAGKVSWEQVPYASKYEVEVRDASGRTAVRAEIEGGEYQIPSEVFRREKLGESFTVRVSTVTEGALRSVPAVRGFSADEAWGLARSDGSSGVPKPRERALPPQPPALALSPEEVEERFTLAGEVPLPPSRDDWSRARTPAQLANLRTRTIASARLEISRDLDLSRERDLRFKAGFLYGSRAMSTEVFEDGIFAAVDHRSAGAEYQLAAVLGQDRPWGAELAFRTTPVDYGIGRELDLSAASASVVRNFGLDPYWQSVLSLRFGAELYVIPHAQTVDFSGTEVFPVSVTGIALGAGLGYRLALDDQWSAAARFDVLAGPAQSVLDGRAPAKASDMRGEAGAVYRASPELELEAGFAAGRAKVSAEEGSDTFGTAWVSFGAYVRGVYRTPSGERRAPASLLSASLPRLAEARLTIPLAFRSQAVIGTSVGATTARGMESGAGLRLGVRLGRGSRWFARGDLDSISGSSAHGAFRLGYEAPLLGREDTRGAVLLGPGFRRDTDSGNPEVGDVSARIVALEPGIRVSRRISESLSGEAEFSVGVPLSVRSGSGGGSGGISRYWCFELSLGHRLGDSLTLWTGYAHRNAQYSTTEGPGGDPNGAMNFTRNEDQARVGVAWEY